MTNINDNGLFGRGGEPVVVFHDGDTAESFVQSLEGWHVQLDLVDGTRRTIKVTGTGRTEGDSWLTIEGESFRDDDDVVEHMDGDDVTISWEHVVRLEVW